MKVKLKNVLGLAVLGMTLLTNIAPTQAGLESTEEVFIDTNYSPTEFYAAGSMVGARNSADSRQYIGCSLDTTPRVMCAAQNSAANVYCVSTDAQHIGLVQRMTDSSFIAFKVNRANLACSSIYINNSSKELK